MGIRAHNSDSPTPSSPSGSIMAPTIKFRAKNKDGKLVITVVSCSNLPDADLAGIGFGNKSDPYVTVRIGKDGEKQQTKAIPGKLNPVFKKETCTFTFDVDGDVTAKRIYFEVMDKDTFTKDDLIGEASHKLSQARPTVSCSPWPCIPRKRKIPTRTTNRLLSLRPDQSSHWIQLTPCDIFEAKFFQSKYLSVDTHSNAICLPIPEAQIRINKLSLAQSSKNTSKIL